MKKTLWTKNFSLLIVASTLGSIGGIAGGFALSFLVFDETGSTLASALILAMEVIPGFLLPLMAAPWMDRLPRKPFLVAGDALCGILYALGGVYLLLCPFTYAGYLMFALMLACLGAFDSLAYDSIYPKLIPEGMEQKGYAVASMLYPILRVVMMPVAALLLETIGVAWILIIQGMLSMTAALVESFIRIHEESRMDGERFSLKMWLGDVREAAVYLKEQPGLRNLYRYMAITNGVGTGYGPLLVAFFRVTAGFTTAMYSLFSVAEFIGRTLGGAVQYTVKMPKKKQFCFVYFVYLFYEIMDVCLLWIPYPLMLVNRGMCGFLGANSATLRQSAVQRYIPEHLRARLNAYASMLFFAASAVLTLLIGLLGEVVDYRVAMTICGLFTMLCCWLTIWRRRKAIRPIYEAGE